MLIIIKKNLFLSPGDRDFQECNPTATYYIYRKGDGYYNPKTQKFTDKF